MAKDHCCPQCGSKLAEDSSSEGLYLKCLLRLGLEAKGSNSEDELGATLEQSEDERTLLPDSIGPYRILRLLGEGGMGTVYLAEQEEPIRREVALKIIKLGMDTREVIARFETERQALALMDHPNIARVFDAGSTERGRPYFAMEVVDGIPITDFCDKHRLNTRDRLNLFMTVCEAIHHAHQKAIIHRDIKPSNVLVKLADGKATPKIIDFGIAKAINRRLTEKTLFTDHGVAIGTPAYMSPEQAETGGTEVDTRTDIYSLGILLYELLVGDPPFDAKSLRRAGYDEIRRIIREVEPPTLVSRLNSLGDSAKEVARARMTDPASLARQIRGDLEWITRKALEKSPIRRYRSAAELADDIQKYEDALPVLAGPPKITYRIGKFTKRYRLALSGLGSLGIILLISLSVVLSLYFRSEGARHRAQIHGELDRFEARALQAVFSGDLTGYLERSAETQEMRRKLLGQSPADLAPALVRHLLILESVPFDRKPNRSILEKVERDAVRTVLKGIDTGDPAILETARLLANYFKRKDATTARELYRAMLESQEREPKPDSDGLLQDTDALCSLVMFQASESKQEGDFKEAIGLYREALTLWRKIGRDRQYASALAERNLGETLFEIADYEEAEHHLLSSCNFLSSPNSVEAGISVQALIRLYEAWKKNEDAAHYRELLPEPVVVAVRELGPLQYPVSVRNRWGGFSSVFKQDSVWVFATKLAGESSQSSSWAIAKADGSDGLDQPVEFDEMSDSPALHRPLLQLTPEEWAFNNGHDDQWLLEPGPLFFDPERNHALLFYQKILDHRSGLQGLETVGSSLAVWRDPAQAPVRGEFRGGSVDPTILFPSPEPALGAAVVVSGGYLYSYAENRIEGFETACIVARVPLARALERDQWQFFDGVAWSKDWHHARPVLKAAPAFTVHWNRYLGKFLAIYNHGLSNTIALKTADQPEGPWSEPIGLHEGLTPWEDDRTWNSHALAHPELARENGRIEYLTYCRPTGWFKGEIRLVEIRFR